MAADAATEAEENKEKEQEQEVVAESQRNRNGLAKALPTLPAAATVTVLIPPSATHAGAGTMYVDGAMPTQFLGGLDALFDQYEEKRAQSSMSARKTPA